MLNIKQDKCSVNPGFFENIYFLKKGSFVFKDCSFFLPAIFVKNFYILWLTDVSDNLLILKGKRTWK
jgi:hypothetical protein